MVTPGADLSERGLGPAGRLPALADLESVSLDLQRERRALKLAMGWFRPSVAKVEEQLRSQVPPATQAEH